MTTKDQERAALAKIKEALATLHGESYVLAAFAGCVKLAEENIANDWLQSWPEIAESHLMTEEEKATCMSALLDRLERTQKQAKEAAEKIVKFADDPSGCPFALARQAHRIAMANITKMEAARKALAKTQTRKD